MANLNRIYVFATSFISGIAVLFTIVSLSTEQWVVTTKARKVDSEYLETIRYGLFEGTHKMTIPTTTTVQLSMTCSLGNNVCAVLCGRNSQARLDLLNALYQNQATTDPYSECPSVKSTATFYTKNEPPLFVRASNTDHKKFINAGVWVATIFFLCVSLIFGVLSTGLSFYNTVFNPIESYLSVFGLYIYNGIACTCCALAMALWGVMYHIIMFYDIGIYYTLVGQMDTEKTAHLGYSFWILLISTFFYFGSVCVLYLRQYLLSKDPGHKIVQREESADPVIYLY